jgi:hypothetical protein
MATEAVYDRRTGWITFAAMVMFSIAFLRIISAISYFSDSNKVNDLTAGLFGDSLWAWGLWDLVIAVLALFAAYSLLAGGEFGRVVAYVWAVVLIVESFLIIGLAPWYAAGAIALASLVLYGLATTDRTGLRR